MYKFLVSNNCSTFSIESSSIEAALNGSNKESVKSLFKFLDSKTKVFKSEITFCSLLIFKESEITMSVDITSEKTGIIILDLLLRPLSLRLGFNKIISLIFTEYSFEIE